MKSPIDPDDHARSAESGPPDEADVEHWISAIQQGDESAWRRLIDTYEGRLLAFVRRRLGSIAAAEDVVQETLVGFLVSLPNYDAGRHLENYLFTICRHKLTDHLRRSGRRPTLSLVGGSQDASGGDYQPVGHARVASSIARSVERQQLEQSVVAEAIASQIDHWRQSGNYRKLKTIEMCFVAGRGNNEVAALLGLTEQQVANLKSDFLTRIKAIIRRRDLDPGVFPELTESGSAESS
ncbi:MAG: sigma-70 family RNA polymerase sigma factor [Planctomycetota bacterium]